MSSKAQIHASAKYDKKHTRSVMLKLNNTSDADILEKLNRVDNKQGYIKNLIRSDLRNMGGILSQEAISMLILPFAKKYQLKKVYLFGSYARGDAISDSDVDLLIEGGKNESMYEYLDLVSDLEKAIGKKVDLVEYQAALDNQTRSGRRFLQHIEKEKVLLYE